MRQKFDPPDCLLNSCKRIFPKIKFSKIDFYLNDSLVISEHPANTVYRLFRYEINIHPDVYEPCSLSTFVTFVHELTHVMQGRSKGFVAARVATITCWLYQGTDPEETIQKAAACPGVAKRPGAGGVITAIKICLEG